MSTRTVRLDPEAESSLERLRKVTGLSISELLKRGVQAYEHTAMQQSMNAPYDVFRRLELGAGGWSLAPSNRAKHALRKSLRAKHR